MAIQMGLTGPLAGILNAADFDVALNSDLFAGISRPLLELTLPRCRLVALDDDEVLIERGATNEFVYLVLSGGVHVRLDDGKLPHHFALGAGECVGEISVIDGNGASALVVADGPTRLLAIDRKSLWFLVANTETMARNLLLIFSGRMRRDNDLLLSSLREREEFGRIASVDGLTGLHNRRWLEFIYPRQLLRCRRNGLAASLVVADLDGFGRFNERYSHLRGDRALQQIGEALGERVRPNDMLVRYDADEFVMLLPGTGIEQALPVAERLRQTVAERALAIGEPGETPEHLTASVGVVEARPDDDVLSLMDAAEAAAHEAAAAGGNRVSAARR